MVDRDTVLFRLAHDLIRADELCQSQIVLAMAERGSLPEKYAEWDYSHLASNPPYVLLPLCQRTLDDDQWRGVDWLVGWAKRAAEQDLIHHLTGEAPYSIWRSVALKAREDDDRQFEYLVRLLERIMVAGRIAREQDVKGAWDLLCRPAVTAFLYSQLFFPEES